MDEVQNLLSNVLSHGLSSKVNSCVRFKGRCSIIGCLPLQESVSHLRGVVATREVELRDEGGYVARHSFNLDNVEAWAAAGGYGWLC